LSGRKETIFFSVSRYIPTPGQCYASQISKGTNFGVGKVCFYVKKCACGHCLKALLFLWEEKLFTSLIATPNVDKCNRRQTRKAKELGYMLHA
jgi:hypothetical protein